MKIRPIAALLTVGAAASIAVAPIALAPIAEAAPTTVQAAAQHIAPYPQKCTTTNAGSECISPGNAQINDAPPFVDNFPMYGFFPWIL
jgi:hypothetical protein